MVEPTTLHDFLLAEAERWEVTGKLLAARREYGFATACAMEGERLREQAERWADRVVVKPRNETDTMTALPVEYADSVAALQARLTAEGRGM